MHQQGSRQIFRVQMLVSRSLLLSGLSLTLVGQPGWAQTSIPTESSSVQESTESSSSIKPESIEEQNAKPQLNIDTLLNTDGVQPAATVRDWMAQIEASLVQITGVQLAETKTGLQVMLEAGGAITSPTTQSQGNTLILDIPNAQLNLVDETAAEQLSPVMGIDVVRVTALPGDQVRVAIVGTDALPVAEVQAVETGLELAVTPGTAEVVEDTEVEITVTAEQQDEGYNPSSSSTATRTDTPLRDLPASVQVIPKDVIKDQGVTELRDAIQNNTPGVIFGDNYGGTGAGSLLIRGFFTASRGFGTTYRDGFRDTNQYTVNDLANIERIDILRGPASILFGRVQPGGIVNIVTEKPLSEPTYTIGFTAGQFSFYRPEIDFSGPLTDDGKLLYRLNAAYQNSGSFRDEVHSERFFIAPVLQWDISENTSLTVDFSYLYNDPVYDDGLIALSDGSRVLPIERFLNYPSLDGTYTEQVIARYRLNHRFNDDWQLRNAFSFSSDLLATGRATFGSFELIDDRFLQRTFKGNERYRQNNYQLQTDLIGNFSTGPIDHKLTVGFDLSRLTLDGSEQNSSPTALPPLDIFNPNYEVERPAFETSVAYGTRVNSLGIYIQDQIDITDNLLLSLGGRLSFIGQEDFTVGVARSNQSNTAFSPNVGIIYKPIESISLYASYAQSFNPAIGRSQDGSTFKPERGTQYEIGVKADITENLSATLAAFDITRSNVLTTDPSNSDFRIQVGEQRSQGIELLLTGEILPGWNIYSGYAYTNARVTEDNDIPVGDSLSGVPEHTANLWTTYEIQSGDFQGLGFGFGLRFVGERETDLPNDDFEFPSHVRADAALFYKRDNWRAAINVNNLFDTEYFDGGNRSSYFPGAPFNVRVSFSYTF